MNVSSGEETHLWASVIFFCKKYNKLIFIESIAVNKAKPVKYGFLPEDQLISNHHLIKQHVEKQVNNSKAKQSDLIPCYLSITGTALETYVKFTGMLNCFLNCMINCIYAKFYS